MFNYTQDNDFISCLMIVAFVANFIIVLVNGYDLIAYTLKVLVDKYSNKISERKKSEKDSLVIEFIMAKKNKICPIIEFE